MGTAAAYTAAVTGIEGHVVKVEAGVSVGLPSTVLTGLSDSVLREARDRVRAAIVNSGERRPSAKITVSLLPVSLPKRGFAYDLAIAVTVLAANGDLSAIPKETAFLAELSTLTEERFGPAYPNELEHFARCVRDGLAPEPSAADALAAFDLARAAEQSWRSGRTVTVAAERTDDGVRYAVKQESR